MRTQIFISYRREGGESLARVFYDRLVRDGYNVFLDVESLRSGPFNKALYAKIEEATDFLLILPPNALDRCKDPEDWLRLEIEHAFKTRKNIIPVMMRNFIFPEKGLPKTLIELPRQNGIIANMEFFDAVYEKLKSKYLNAKPQKLPTTWSINKVISGIKNCLIREPSLAVEDIDSKRVSEVVSFDEKYSLEIVKLPEKISLFDIIGASNIGEFNIEKIWKTSDVTKLLAAPIGMDSNGNVVWLDLHQRTDGPNGMIIGPAGSGKTEFLHTYLLSLALHYPPSMLQMHLINVYDSIAMHDFLLLPHMGVCLDEFSQEKVSDFVSYFKQEIARRQKILDCYHVKNIYQFLKLSKNDPSLPNLPHIIVAVDELQGLKCLFPEETKYLQELGTGEQARTFGIHLIYATGCAEGIVDDSLYSVLNFRICSSMQSSQISSSVIRERGKVGRFYLQTQSCDSIREIQLAYSGLSATIENNKLAENQWFFNHKNQRQAIIQAIKRICLD